MFTAKELAYLPNSMSLIKKGTLFGTIEVPILFQIQFGETEKPLIVNIRVINSDSSKPEYDLTPIEDNIVKLTVKRAKDTPTYTIDRLGLANHFASGSDLSIRFMITPLNEATFFIFNYELYSEQPQVSIPQEAVEAPA